MFHSPRIPLVESQLTIISADFSLKPDTHILRELLTILFSTKYYTQSRIMKNEDAMHYQRSTSKYHFPLIAIVLVTCLLLIFGLLGCASDSTPSSSSNERRRIYADPSFSRSMPQIP